MRVMYASADCGLEDLVLCVTAAGMRTPAELSARCWDTAMYSKLPMEMPINLPEVVSKDIDCEAWGVLNTCGYNC